MLGVLSEGDHVLISLVCLASYLLVVFFFLQWHRTHESNRVHDAPDPRQNRNTRIITQHVDRTPGRSTLTPDEPAPRSQRKSRRGKNRLRQHSSPSDDRRTGVDTDEARVDNFQTPQDDVGTGFQAVPHRRRSMRSALNVDLEKDKPYIQAIIQNNPKIKELDMKRALVYLHKYDVLEKSAKAVLKAIYHMQDLAAKPGRGELSYHGYKIPKDYNQEELKTIASNLHSDMTHEEFLWVYQEFRKGHGYPPTPFEFSRLFEKSIETEKLRKHHTKLRGKYDELHAEKIKVQKEYSQLQLEVTQLELLASRAFCKVCHDNEVSVLYQPCDHAVICRSCFQRCMAGKSKQERVCHICRCPVKTIKTLKLA